VSTTQSAAISMLRAGLINELRELADAGDAQPAKAYAHWLARQGRLDELLARMVSGEHAARWAYADLLVRQRRFAEAVEVMRPLATLGIRGAVRRLSRLLAGLGRVDEALVVFRSRVSASAGVRTSSSWPWSGVDEGLAVHHQSPHPRRT
jgi:hypothetical protein